MRFPKALAVIVPLLLLPLVPAAHADAGVIVARGHFVPDGDHEVAGTVEIVRLPDGSHEARFGPDFHFGFLPPEPFRPLFEVVTLHFDVRILSADEPGTPDAVLAQTPAPGLLGMPDAVLGPLQGHDGAQVYAVPASSDVAKVGSVVVHCADFQALMGHATLVPA